MKQLLIVLSLLSIFENVKPDRILILGETLDIKQTHSNYLDSIKARGHELIIKTADEAQLALFKHGELIFKHLIILSPGVQVFGGSLSTSEISKFVDAGGNVLVAAGSNIGDAIRELAVEHGFEFDEAGTSVIDHFNYDLNIDSGDHTTIVADGTQFLSSNVIVGDASKINPILFKGVGLMASKSNKLALEIVKGSGTSFSYNPKTPRATNPKISGTRTLLIGGIQTRNNARVVFTGSVELFSNAFFAAKVNSVNPTVKNSAKSGNAELTNAITEWVLKEKGVLRVKNVQHHLVGETQPPPQEYTIMDDVTYTIEIEELKNGVWAPFYENDVQFEFVRIDPFVRQTLKNNKGVFSTTFKLPDVYGVFKFLVDYRRVGYTHLYDVKQTSVRPLWHTQYERFIRSAYPYYASSFSMMIGLVLFSIVYLYHKDESKIVTGKSKN